MVYIYIYIYIQVYITYVIIVIPSTLSTELIPIEKLLWWLKILKNKIKLDLNDLGYNINQRNLRWMKNNLVLIDTHKLAWISSLCTFNFAV